MSDWIARIESHVGAPLVPKLRELYKRRDGEEGGELEVWPRWSIGMRMLLMPSSRVIGAFDSFASCVSMHGSCPFWAGSNGEFAAVYLEGPLTGRVYFWATDGRNDSVAYRSVDSFLETMDASVIAEKDWYEWPTDYYVDSEYFFIDEGTYKPASEADIAADVEARRQLQAEYTTATINDEFDDFYYAFNIMGLTPMSETDSILPFLDVDDMWIPARAANILGQRRFEPAIAKLGEVARRGTNNGRTAALQALGRIGTRKARDQVLQSLSHFGKGEEYFVAQALRRCGCDVREENVDPRGISSSDYLFRLPQELQWRPMDSQKRPAGP